MQFTLIACMLMNDMYSIIFQSASTYNDETQIGQKLLQKATNAFRYFLRKHADEINKIFFFILQSDLFNCKNLMNCVFILLQYKINMKNIVRGIFQFLIIIKSSGLHGFDWTGSAQTVYLGATRAQWVWFSL